MMGHLKKKKKICKIDTAENVTRAVYPKCIIIIWRQHHAFNAHKRPIFLVRALSNLKKKKNNSNCCYEFVIFCNPNVDT